MPHRINETPKEPKPKYEPPAQTKSTEKAKAATEEMVNLITSNLAPNDIRELLGFQKLESMEHEHKWVHMETDKKERMSDHGYCTILKRKDKFYCEKCLEIKTVAKGGTRNTREDYPDWW
jgi:hypothetical protein